MSGFPVHHQLPELAQTVSIELVMPSNHLILCGPLFLLPSIFPIIKVFSNELVLCIRWLKYWSFSFSISPSNAFTGFISFRIDWFDFLAVQGTLKSLLQHHSSKASILWCSTFFMVQLAHLYMTTGETCHKVNIIIPQPRSRGLHFTCARRMWQLFSSYRVQGHTHDSIYPQRNVRPRGSLTPRFFAASPPEHTSALGDPGICPH